MALLRPVILALVLGAFLAAPSVAQALPSVSVSDATVPEGAATASFTVTLSEDPGVVPVTVSYATGDGSAKTPGDYEERSGVLVFGLGETEKTVEVPVQDDALDEDAESFTLTLSTDPVLATITDPEGVGTITDDDEPPSLTIGDSIVPEGNSGTSNAVFQVSLSAPSGKPISVDYTTQDGNAHQPGDYTQTSSPPPVTFAPGEISKTVSVPIVADTIEEAPIESFTLKATGAVNASLPLDELGVGFIFDDDNKAPTARIDVNPQRAFVGKVVEFNGSRSSDPEGGPLSHLWDLDGDGSYETPTGPESAIGLAFFGPGRQAVGLRVTDRGGLSGDARAAAEIFAAPGAAPDKTAPRTRLVGARRNLRTALRSGLRARLRCSEACLIAGSVGVDRRTGGRIGLRGRHRTMGRAFSATTKAGSKVLTFKLSRRARRALAEVERVRVTLRFSVRDSAKNKRVSKYRITLRR